MSFQDLEAGRAMPVCRQQEPSQAVAAGIFQINTAVYSFTRLVGSLGTPKDTLEMREKLHKTRQRIGDLVKETSAKLKQTSEVDRFGDVSPAKKINDAKLAREFRTCLNEFQKAQRLAAERETMYAPVVPKEALPSTTALMSWKQGCLGVPPANPSSKPFFYHLKDKKWFSWTMRSRSMKLLLKSGIKGLKKYSNKLVR